MHHAAWACAATLAIAACGGGAGAGDAVGPDVIELTVSVVRPGPGTQSRITSVPAGIDCGSTCSAGFAAGTQVTLTAQAGPGERFSAWGGACSGSVPTCTVQMTDVRRVTALFVVAPPPSSTGWSDSAVLSADGAGQPRVGIDGAGNATAIWLQRDSASFRNSVWASRRSAGGVWSAPALLESSDTDFFEADIAVDSGSGKVMAVWRGTTAPEIYARPADASGVWGKTTAINGVGDNINDLQVGIDTNGNAVAVWSQTPVGSTITSIWSNRFGTASGWGGAEQVAVAVNGRQDLDPSLAMSASGQAFVVWTRSGSGVVESRATATGVWSPASVLAAGTVSIGVGAPRVVADANGNAMAVWAQGARDANNQYVTNLASKRFASGAWSGSSAALYPPIVTSTLGGVRLAVTGTGQFAAIWTQPDASIRAVQSTSSGVWSAPLLVRPAGLEIYSQPQVGIDALGNMFATWAARAGNPAGTPEVWLNQFSSGSGWAAGAVHQTSVEATGIPRIAMNDQGQAVMGWIRNGSDGSRVISRSFASGR